MSVLVRVVRRICVLREQDRMTEAVQLEESELADAVRDFRLAQGPEALPEGDLRDLFAVETSRVADAAVLSELLLPRLVQRVPVATGPIHAGSSRARSDPVPIAARAAPLAGPPGITELLDAMLAAERPGHRPAAADKPESRTTSKT